MLSTTHRDLKLSQFAQLGLRGGEMVFLGDSITEGCLWHEWFPGVTIANRGIAGDNTEGVLSRLDTAIASPAKVFLMIGTNDVALRRPVDQIIATSNAIVRQIVSTTPPQTLVVQSVLPRQKRYRERIQRLNTSNCANAERAGATYLDLWPQFSDHDGGLREEFTRDGVHLNSAGYRTWIDVLRPIVVDNSPPATTSKATVGP